MSGTLHTTRLFQLSMLALAVWSGTYIRFVIGPLQESVRSALALGDNQMALLQGVAMAVPMAVGAMPLGLLADRFSRKRILVLFLALAFVSCLMSAQAAGFADLFAARCLAGLCSSAILVAAYSTVGDLYPPDQRGRATMLMAISDIGGAPAAFALGGLFWGMSVSMSGLVAGDWRWSLLWMAVPLILVFLCMFLLREPARVGRALEKPPLNQVWQELWSHRAIAGPLLLARAMVWIADGAVVVWAAPLFARKFHLSPDRIGAIMGTILLLAGLSGAVLGGLLVDFFQSRGGPRRTMRVLAALALASALFASFPMLPQVSWASFSLGVFLTLGFSISTAGVAMGIIVIPADLRGFYLGATVMGGALFFVGLAPLIVSLLSGALGGEAMIGHALAMVCSAVSLLGATVFARSARGFPASTPRLACEVTA